MHQVVGSARLWRDPYFGPTGWASKAGTGVMTVVLLAVLGLSTQACKIPIEPESTDSKASPVAAAGEFVGFPSAELELILGPQLVQASSANPWLWFDSNLDAKGREHGSAFPETPTGDYSWDQYVNLNYYDQALVQYINYYRTGDVTFLNYARKIADSWWQSGVTGSGTVAPENTLAPRNASLGGLILRALDGKPEYWPWILSYVDYNYSIWVERIAIWNELSHGVRDSGFMQIYMAWVAAAHPDPTIRQQSLQRAIAGARIFVDQQRSDGTWAWPDVGGSVGGGDFWQPFMIGLLLEGLIATHRLDPDPALGDAIVKGTEALYRDGFRGGEINAMWYFVGGNDCTPPTVPACGMPLPHPSKSNSEVIEESRQLNSTTIHAFGYAYKISGDPRFLTWGDQIFAATYRGLDQYSGLAYFRAKEYDQSYRAGGKYLAWRAGE